MRNIEIKTPLRDRAGMERRLKQLGATREWVRRQKDTFFAAPRSWLKLREEEGRGAELISYTRPTSRAGPRASTYDVAPLRDATLWRRLLGRALDVEAVVEKERALWRWRHTRIHLDRVDGLGDYLELETVVEGFTGAQAEREAQELIEALKLDPARFVAVPYRDLLAGGAAAAAARGGA